MIMEQHRLTPGILLDGNGNLSEAGYAFSLVKQYNRALVAAKNSRLKEWDYYYIGNENYGIALTIDDNGYMNMASISVLDFRGTPKDITKSIIGMFPKTRLPLPESSVTGDIKFENKKKRFSMEFRHEGKKRHLLCYMEEFGDKKETFHCDIYLEETFADSMVIATPFKKAGHFYYNQKINGLKASGYAKLGEQVYDMNDRCYGVLDWGRGVWTYKNTWYWSSLNALLDGKPFGWNLGYGFGDTSKASENMVFYAGRAFKLDDVKFDIPMDERGRDVFRKPWQFRSSSGDIAVTFQPVYDRHSDTNLLILRSNQHQVFGLFSGYVLLDGRRVQFENLPGFAEKVFNKW